MNKDNKKTILEEAAFELQQILEAANINAKDKIAKEMSEKFEEILSEEIKKIKDNKESVKESVEDKKEEPVSEGTEKTDDKKESLNEMEEIDMKELSMAEIGEAYDEAHPDDEFEVELSVDDIASELGEMEQMASDAEAAEVAEADNPSDPYSKIKQLYEMMSEMIREMDDEKTNAQMSEAFDGHMKEMYGEGYKDNLGDDKVSEMLEMFIAHKKGDPFDDKASVNESAEPVNEALDPVAIGAIAGPLALAIGTLGVAGVKAALKKFNPKAAQAMDQLSQSAVSGAQGSKTSFGEGEEKTGEEINESEAINEAIAPELLQAIGGSLGVIAGAGGLAALEQVLKNKFPQAHAKLGQVAGALGSGIKGGSTPAVGESIGEMKDVGGMSGVDQNAGNPDNAGGPTKEKIAEENSEEDREEEEKVDEIHGQSFSAGKVRAGSLPNDGAGYRDREGHSRNRGQWSARNENYQKRMTSLIEENKKLTVTAQEANGKNEELKKVVETYNENLEKYRNQLQEMAVLNTNIANVNDILIKESNLTTEEKQEIINKFKDVGEINESEKIHKEILSEMKEDNKETLDESIEEKITDTLGESSSKLVEQVVEKTAFVGNAHIDEIKKKMNYMRV